MNIRIVAGALLLAGVAFSIGRFSGPTKVETKEVERVVYRDRVVEDKKRNIETTTKETQHPDGTKVKETTTRVVSETKKDTAREATSDKVKETDTESRPDWRLGVIYKPQFAFQAQTYGVTVERRIFGEVYLGVTGATDRTLGLLVTVGF